MVKSYVSVIKAILQENDIEVNENRYLLNSLTNACHLQNDEVYIRFPIQHNLLGLLLKSINHHFGENNQPYLQHLYLALMSTMYFGLFRIGELTESPHMVKASNVHIGLNKHKILFVLFSSKTHTKGNKPQTIKITNTSRNVLLPDNKSNFKFCPYILLCNYLECRPKYVTDSENFFIFRDRSMVKPWHLELYWN